MDRTHHRLVPKVLMPCPGVEVEELPVVRLPTFLDWEVVAKVEAGELHVEQRIVEVAEVLKKGT